MVICRNDPVFVQIFFTYLPCKYTCTSDRDGMYRPTLQTKYMIPFHFIIEYLNGIKVFCNNAAFGLIVIKICKVYDAEEILKYCLRVKRDY